MKKIICIVIALFCLCLVGCGIRGESNSVKEAIDCQINLVDDQSTCDNDNVEINGNSIIIRQDGYYKISGSLSNGQILIDAVKGNISLELDNANISAQKTAPIYIKNAKSVNIILKENTVNTINQTGGFIQTDTNNVDSAIFSKGDLIFLGLGKLIVNSSGSGITSKDSLVINNGDYLLNVEANGFEGKDSISIINGTIDISAKQDAIHADNDVVLSLGNFIMSDGIVKINCLDDAIHASCSLQINAGTIIVESCLEGLEAKQITINSGSIDITANDDGINASLGAEVDSSDGSVFIKINGGDIKIVSYGDGIDSNGDLFVNGGITKVFGPNTTRFGFGALDYFNKAEISGGVLVCLTVQGKSFLDTSSQVTLTCNLDMQTAGTKFTLKDAFGNVIVEEVGLIDFNSVIISSPLLVVGNEYTVEYNGISKTVRVSGVVSKSNLKTS